MEKVKIIECPRDAMQGIKEFIPTEQKIAYINQLLKVGFDTIDFGSFVSPKAIPQMRDTAEVLERLDLTLSNTKLLAIIANERGAKDASEFAEIEYLGYPFSISETFQQRNTNASIEESLSRLEKINALATNAQKKLVVYISMGFGNPYGDAWSPEIVVQWAERLNNEFGIEILALSDTIGVSKPEIITSLFSTLIPELPQVEFGAHLHSTPFQVTEKVEAAYQAGCRRFDGAIKGFGGCPMATDELTGNMTTELMIEWMRQNNIDLDLNFQEFEQAVNMSTQVFPL